MPRLLGYRERVNTNLWDASPVRDLQVSQRLFGNRHIGTPSLCNLAIGGQLGSDSTLIITNWYARTNVLATGTAFEQAWIAWTNTAVAQLMIGSRPHLQRPLGELLGPRDMSGGIGGHDQFDEQPTHREQLAMALYKAYSEAQKGEATGPFPEGPPAHGMETWHDLTGAQKRGWLNAVAAVRPLSHPLVVPVRQNFGVVIGSDRVAWSALMEILPTNIAPQALVWIHLDGLVTRDVA